MTTHTWTGGTGLWTNAALWADGAVPLLDDVAVANAGTVIVGAGVSLDAETLLLGAPVELGPAVLLSQGATFGYRFAIVSTAEQQFAALNIRGVTGFGGTIDAASSGGVFTIQTGSSDSAPGDLILNYGGTISVTGGDTLALNGRLDNHGMVEVGGGSVFADNGTLTQASAWFAVHAGGLLTGTGSVEIGLYSSLRFEAGALPCALPVVFTDSGGRLQLADPANFTGSIGNFQQGDLIDIAGEVVTSASIDASSGVMTVSGVDLTGHAMADVQWLMPGAAPGPMQLVADGNGGTLIQEPGSLDRLKYTAAADDRAMHADTARATLTTQAGAAIDGSGIRIGIISNSFDQAPGIGAADSANAAALAGYLPLNSATGTSAVTVLSDAVGSGADNEGQAMAELIHQTAPGAQLYFATGTGGTASFASAVSALQAAGCNVIVDDWTYWDEPFFENAGPVDGAIESAVAAGVSFFTAAGNFGGAAYQSNYTPQAVTLLDGSQVNAEIFSTGSPYQTLTLRGGVAVTIALQWAVPWTSASTALGGGLFDASGALAASFQQSGTQPETLLSITPSVTGQYRLFIDGPLAAGVTFKYIMYGAQNGGTAVPGTIDYPAANAGSISGHALLPDVNTIGAVDFATTPAFGSLASYTSYYSSIGAPGLLNIASGGSLPNPLTSGQPTLLAPVGAGTTVPGFAPFEGTSAAAPNAAAVAALMLQANPALTPEQVTEILTESATDLNLPGNQQGAGLIDAVQAVKLALAAACYAQGTRLATARGAIPIERLRIGDRLYCADGQLRPAIWLGRRQVDCTAYPVPEEVWPIRVQAHAFAPNCPVRDVYLSPDHAVFTGGALVPVRYLLNGASIAQAPRASVTYWHVELPAHAVLLAENLPAESFLDTGNRAAFEGDATLPPLPPAAALRVWHANGCAKLVTDGPILHAARAHLRQRAAALGHVLTADWDVRVLADGVALPLRQHGTRYFATLPPGAASVRLQSRSFVPAHLDLPDHRRLGIAIGGLRLDGAAVAPHDPRLSYGWHAAEPHWRWTDGDAELRTSGARELAFSVALAGQYWQHPAPQRRAA